MHEFIPQWASPPGQTIQAVLNEITLSFDQFCSKVHLTVDQGTRLLSGDHEIDEHLASQLSDTLGSTPKFWLRRESQYREDCARLEEAEHSAAWLGRLPLADLVRHRWIAPNLRGERRAQACLDYFGVRSFIELSKKYENQLHTVAFRTSASFDANPESVVSWLRQGEIQAYDQNLESWDINKFRKAVTEARELTLEPDPSVFVPALRSLFSKCGVAIAIAPTPKGCPASGAVYFFEEDKAVILLSFRYLSDDHFWFTLFHECGHLILHTENRLFLEGTGTIEEAQEKEANIYAEKLLIPEEYSAEFQGLNSKNLRGIVKFARKLGVAKGIVVGQLQHRGLVSQKHLNKLKVRYRWR